MRAPVPGDPASMEGLGCGPLVLFMTRKDLCPECHVLSVFMDGGRCDYPPSCKRGEGAGEVRGARRGQGGDRGAAGCEWRLGATPRTAVPERREHPRAARLSRWTSRGCFRANVHPQSASLLSSNVSAETAPIAGAVLPEARADEGKGAKKVAFCMLGRKLV